MLQDSQAFSGYSVDDIQVAKHFYHEKLGLTLHEESDMAGGMFGLKFPNGGSVMIYQKKDHEPATYTVLNFPVDDIDIAVDELTRAGVIFEHYEGMHQDDKGIARSDDPAHGPNIAWFKDPAGNILSVLH